MQFLHKCNFCTFPKQEGAGAMSIKVMSLVWEHSQHKGGDLLALLAIADFADGNGTAYPSIKQIAAMARTTRRHLIRVLDNLKYSDELSIRQNSGPKGRHIYQINMELLGGGDKMTPLWGGDKMSRVEMSPLPAIKDKKESGSLAKGKDPDPSPPLVLVPEAYTNTSPLPKSTPYGKKFLAFWTIYPRKVGKGAAWNSWKRQNLNAMADTVIDSVQNHLDNDPAWQNGYIKHPATYLNQQCWSDEFSAADKVDAEEELRNSIQQFYDERGLE
jgi:hypothetical protein